MWTYNRSNYINPSPPPPPPPSQHPAYAGVHPMPATTFLPSTANQADLQHVLNLINQLSEIQEANRKQTSKIVQNIGNLEDNTKKRRLAAEQTTGDDKQLTDTPYNLDHYSPTNPVDVAHLRHQLNQVTNERDNLKTAFDDVAETLNQYEDTLESIMVRVREFANQHTTTLIAWHKHYNTALQRERDANHQLRLEQSKWQESVGRLGEYVRGAYNTQGTLLLPYERQIAALKRENKILKRRCGLEYDESDEDEEAAQAPSAPSAPI